VADEKRFQVFFQHLARRYTHLADVVMSPESNAGCGPVDFVFGTSARVKTVIELKLMSNAHLYDGVLAQTPAYAHAEQTTTANFIAIGTDDSHFTEGRVKKIHTAAEIASCDSGVNTIAFVIDGGPKSSGSNLTAATNQRDELHQRGKDEQPPSAA
jgi:hypothetical protein